MLLIRLQIYSQQHIFSFLLFAFEKNSTLFIMTWKWNVVGYYVESSRSTGALTLHSSPEELYCSLFSLRSSLTFCNIYWKFNDTPVKGSVQLFSVESKKQSLLVYYSSTSTPLFRISLIRKSSLFDSSKSGEEEKGEREKVMKLCVPMCAVGKSTRSNKVANIISLFSILKMIWLYRKGKPLTGFRVVHHHHQFSLLFRIANQSKIEFSSFWIFKYFRIRRKLFLSNFAVSTRVFTFLSIVGKWKWKVLTFSVR